MTDLERIRQFLADECNIKSGKQMIPGQSKWPTAEEMMDYLAPRIHTLIEEACIDELETLITLLNAGEYRHTDDPSEALKFPNHLILQRINQLRSRLTNQGDNNR